MSVFGIEIDERCVHIFGEGTTKEQALDRLVGAVAATGVVDNVDALRRSVRAREDIMSTGIGSGVAIPHVRIEAVRQPVVGVGLSRSGIEFQATDGQPVHIIVLFAMPPDTNKLYLGLLAQVMVALKVPNFADRLTACSSPREAVAVLNESGG